MSGACLNISLTCWGLWDEERNGDKIWELGEDETYKRKKQRKNNETTKEKQKKKPQKNERLEVFGIRGKGTYLWHIRGSYTAFV